MICNIFELYYIFIRLHVRNFIIHIFEYKIFIEKKLF